MKKMRICTAAAVIAMVAMFAGSLLADEAVVKREEVPQPVLATIEKLSPGWALDRAEKQTGKDAADGTLSYEMDGKINGAGKTVRFVVLPDGKLVKRVDRSLAMADIPDNVQQGILKVTNGVQPDVVQKVSPAKGQGFYQFRANKVVNSVTLDGELIPAEKK